jgi:hypothetical protein
LHFFLWKLLPHPQQDRFGDVGQEACHGPWSGCMLDRGFIRNASFQAIVDSSLQCVVIEGDTQSNRRWNERESWMSGWPSWHKTWKILCLKRRKKSPTKIGPWEGIHLVRAAY